MSLHKDIRFQVNNQDLREETAVLVSVVTHEITEEQATEYLDELEFLATTDGVRTVRRFMQKLPHPDPRTYVGKGKLEEIRTYLHEKNVDLVIIDDEISPSQLRNIEQSLNKKVLDRSMLILDIFAQRARTVQAKTQVELAQLQYMLPRLKGMWTHLERQRGGTGTRGGAGEKELETDRRLAEKKISALKNELKKIDKQNAVRRKHRSEMIRVALVGYTNVGKSTLMNLLAKENVFAENKLFATLDTTVRKVTFNGVPFLLSDTVGFIRKLPHHLLESFKSTLDEAIEADILLHVVDISHHAFEEHMKVVNDILNELGCSAKPQIVVFNKMDLYEEKYFDQYLPPDVRQHLLRELKESWMAKTHDNCIFISATQNRNTAELRELIFQKVKSLYLQRYPYKAGYWSDYTVHQDNGY
ncbi:MAG: GTPase HflX [Chitinophagales bacterium]|nr:GTPase HflX [Chitinophagales bacterium]MDW8417888.1 GTPase HflX [Chitinophagales bacterium]